MKTPTSYFLLSTSVRAKTASLYRRFGKRTSSLAQYDPEVKLFLFWRWFILILSNVVPPIPGYIDFSLQLDLVLLKNIPINSIFYSVWLFLAMLFQTFQDILAADCFLCHPKILSHRVQQIKKTYILKASATSATGTANFLEYPPNFRLITRNPFSLYCV